MRIDIIYHQTENNLAGFFSPYVLKHTLLVYTPHFAETFHTEKEVGLLLYLLFCIGYYLVCSIITCYYIMFIVTPADAHVSVIKLILQLLQHVSVLLHHHQGADSLCQLKL